VYNLQFIDLWIYWGRAENAVTAKYQKLANGNSCNFLKIFF